ncbi:MAG: DinB family protein [Chloroflexota bacterium]|nr:MAG: DinB family protein [Chloroflexota bacterium]
MDAKELLLMSLKESHDYLTKTLDGLTQEESAWSPSPECNSISFILWHTTRVEDFFVNRVIRREKELYETKNWQEKLGTPTKAYQYTVEELQAWPAPKLEVLIEYANSVRENTLAFLNSISLERLSEVPRPDRSPDSIGAMLGHVSTEIAMHVGQIAYLRGMKRGLDK